MPTKPVRTGSSAQKSASVFSTHKVNYFSINRWFGNKDAQVKFQISFKAAVAHDLFGDDDHLYVAYTQLSMWHAYNSDYSSPFRETNYEPEAFLAFDTDVPVLGLRNRILYLGFVHQSNGRTEPL